MLIFISLNNFFLGREYDHTPHSLPHEVMKAIRPVFEELASRNFNKIFLFVLLCSCFSVWIVADVLKRVLYGSSQNPNESYHSVLWSMAPKRRYSSGAILDLCVGLSVAVFNDGYQSLLKLLENLCGIYWWIFFNGFVVYVVFL